MNIEERLNEYYNECAEELNISIEQVKEMLNEEYGNCRGYGTFSSDDTEVLHIEKIDDMYIYESDLDASIQAEKDGIKLIHDIEIPKDSILYYYKDTFVDTKENRKFLKKELDKCLK